MNTRASRPTETSAADGLSAQRALDLILAVVPSAHALEHVQNIARQAIRTAAAAVAGEPQAAMQREREAFEAWYCADVARQGHPMPEGVAHLRDGDHYGAQRFTLNGKWEGWKAHAAQAGKSQDRADTERLDWLEAHKCREDRDGGYSAFYQVNVAALNSGPYAEDHGQAFDHRTLRDAIDAARKATGGTAP